jgi:hypothetical protein
VCYRESSYTYSMLQFVSYNFYYFHSWTKLLLCIWTKYTALIKLACDPMFNRLQFRHIYSSYQCLLHIHKHCAHKFIDVINPNIPQQRAGHSSGAKRFCELSLLSLRLSAVPETKGSWAWKSKPSSAVYRTSFGSSKGMATTSWWYGIWRWENFWPVSFFRGSIYQELHIWNYLLAGL